MTNHGSNHDLALNPAWTLPRTEICFRSFRFNEPRLGWGWGVGVMCSRRLPTLSNEMLGRLVIYISQNVCGEGGRDPGLP